MKASQVDKLYAKLTPIELAALAFEALARNDDAERETIIGSVERHEYRDTHWEFRHRFMGYTNLGSYYALIYWKTRTYMEVASSRYNECGNEADQKAAFVFLDTLTAMDVALQDVCAKLNIDVTTIKKLALCEDEAAIGVNGNPELVKEYTNLFMGIVE